MDLEYIDDLIAVNVMKYEEVLNEDLDLVGWNTERGFTNLFKPTTSIEDAFKVINKIQDDYAWKIEMYNEELEVDVRVGRGCYTDKSIPLAISLATLKHFKIDYE